MKTSHSNTPPRPPVDKEGYLPWINAFRSALPQLAALTRFPRDLSTAARNAYLTFPSASQHAPAIGRYYSAPPSAISTYRPPSMLKMFNALHDIVAYANAYCAQEDAAARAAACRARANLKAILSPITITEEQEQESRAILRTMLDELGINPSTSTPTT